VLEWFWPPNPEVPAIANIKAQTPGDFILHIFPEKYSESNIRGSDLTDCDLQHCLRDCCGDG